MTPSRTSTRDPHAVLDALARWLHDTEGTITRPTVESLGGPNGAGLSSDTLLIDIALDHGSGPEQRAAVLRMPPPDDAFPIFPTYDLSLQVEVMQLVGANSTAPIPTIRWADPTGAAIGVPFFVMDRIDGLVAPDLMPYTWGSWVTELDDAAHESMTVQAVDALAAIHSVAPTTSLMDEERSSAPGTTSLDRHLARLRHHYEWARRDREFPTIERAFALLGARVPAMERPDVIVWGDARIGNMLWHDKSLVAVLDWEMTTIGPRELDVAWMTYFASTFQRSAEVRGHRGTPMLLRADAVVSLYERASGVELHSFDWFLALTGLHQSIIGIRTSDRSIAFDGWPEPESPEAIIHSIPTLVELLDALT